MADSLELIILDEAAEDIEAIRDFNEGKQNGLGFKYLEDILDCLDRIHARPKDFQYYKTSKEKIRRGISKKYAIVVLYDIDELNGIIEVLTVADSRQDWWQ